MTNLPSSLLRITAIAAVACTSFLVGCTKQEQHNATAAVKDTYQDSKAAMARTWDNVKGYSFDKKNDFTASAKSATEQMDAQVSQLRANYSEAKATASRKAAMEELKRDEADYKQKLNALGNATSATWDAAKNNVILAFDKMQASYYKARD